MLDRKRGKSYICIDLKSFYASVECADRGLNPFLENLAVGRPRQGARHHMPRHNARNEGAGREKPLPSV